MRIIFFCLLIFGCVQCYAQGWRRTLIDSTNNKNQIESYNQLISDLASKKLPTFGIRDDDNDDASDISKYYTTTGDIPTNMGKVYQKGLNYILCKKEKKAYKYFKGIVTNKKSTKTDREHAAYQLAHFDWYNCFDIYYNGVPSNMAREQLKPFLELGKRHSFANANNKTCLLMCSNPKIPSYDLEQVVIKGANYLCSKKKDEWLFGRRIFYTACDTMMENTVSLYDIYKKYFYNRNHWYQNVRVHCLCDESKISPIIDLTKTLPYLSRMRQISPTSDVGKTAQELYAIAEQSRENNDFVKAHYYYVRAALFGDVRSFVKMYDVLDEHIEYLYNTEKFKKYKNDRMEQELVYCGLDLAECIVEFKEFAEFHAIAEKILEAKKMASKEYHEKAIKELYAEIASKEARRRKRLQFWAAVFQSASQTLGGVMVQMSRVSQNQAAFNQLPSMTGLGNMNQLIDPRFTIAQVNAQEYMEYQQAREGFQRIGKDLSIDEWRTMKGQAIMNMKNEGYDIIAEQKKMNEDNKAFNEEMRQREKQDRLNRYKEQLGGDHISSSSQISSDSKANRTFDETATKKRVSHDQYNMDSKEQYKREPVSSDDYQFVKHVNIYFRDGNSYRVMFSNKDLCKKGAHYYVKIGDKYYLVQTEGLGFNSSILYSSSKLYFNK